MKYVKQSKLYPYGVFHYDYGTVSVHTRKDAAIKKAKSLNNNNTHFRVFDLEGECPYDDL